MVHPSDIRNIAVLLTPLTALALTGCFQSGRLAKDTLTATHGSRVEESAQTVLFTITSRGGQPIAGARVLIGPKENTPFPGNLLMTDSKGQVRVPPAWVDPQPITIDAPGFVRATYFDRLPQSETLTLRSAPTTTPHQLTGETTGYGNLARDGYIDIGIVVPALTRTEANTLQMGLLISPESDEMSVVGQTVQVPTNIAFPTQTETYIFPLTFSKPVYRMEFDEARTWKVAAVHARFPLRDVIREMQAGKSFFDIVNYFEFREASIRDITIKGKTKIDLPVNEIRYKPTLSITAPAYDSKYSMFSVSLANDNGLYILADVKRLDPNEKQTLCAPKSNTDGLIVSVLRGPDETGAASENMSAVIQPTNQSRALDFLPVASQPDLRSGTLVLNPPRVPATLEPAVTYAVLSKVEVSEKDGAKVENKVPQWELYAEEWASSLTLPEMPGTAPKGSTASRWTVLFAGQPQGIPKELPGPGALEKVSHVTRSAVDF